MTELTGGFNTQRSTIAEAVAGGQAFRVGRRTFRVKAVIRGSLSNVVTDEVIPQIRKLPGGPYKMGLYGPDEPCPLLVAFELERIS